MTNTVIAGAGLRTPHWFDRLERDLGSPFVPADSLLYRTPTRSLHL